MNRRAFVGCAAGFLVAASVPAAAASLTVAIDPYVHGLDPYVDPTFETPQYAWLISDGLIGWKDGRPVPGLAALPVASDAEATYRYQLRTYRWSDGRPVTADDVCTIVRKLTSSGSRWRSSYPFALIRECVANGASEFTVRLNAPSRDFADAFFSPAGPNAIPLLRTGDGGSPIGTGPFRIVHADPSAVELAAFDGSPRGTPHVSGMVLTFGVDIGRKPDLVLPLVQRVTVSENFRSLRRRGGTTVLVFNAAGALSDASVRRTIVSLIDVNRLRRFLGPGSDLQPASSQSAAPLGRDLLQRRLRLVYPDAPHYRALAATLSDALRALGFVAPGSTAVPFDKYEAPDGPLLAGNYDIGVYGFHATPRANDTASWGCSSLPPAGWNVARLCDAELDRLAAAGDIEGEQRRLRELAAIVPLVDFYEEFLVRTTVKSFRLPSSELPFVYDCADWSL
jgi:ABC-type transport system substrate-binding protein